MSPVQVAGRDRAPLPEPFRVRTRFGRWLPICPRHRLIFPTDARYRQHVHAGCTGGHGPWPASDHLRDLRGYRRIRRWQ